MTPQTELDRLYGEQLAGLSFPDKPEDTTNHREATPVPALPGKHEGSAL